MKIIKNEKIEQYIDYLMDKGKILKIKNPYKDVNIGNGLGYYFLLVMSIICVIGTIYYIAKNHILLENYDLVNKIIILGGMSLFSIILICVTIYEKRAVKFKVTYFNEYQMKINHTMYDLKNDECYLHIYKGYSPINQTRAEYGEVHTYTTSRKLVRYYIAIEKNGKNKVYLMSEGKEDDFRRFIYNFEYEISDKIQQKNEWIQNAENQRYPSDEKDN